MQRNEKTNAQLTQTPSAATAVSTELEGQMTSTAKQSIWLKAFTAVLVLTMGMVGQVQADTQTRTVNFYYDDNGQLTKEVIEPNDASSCLVTEYDYDQFGNQELEKTRNCTGAENDGTATSVQRKLITERSKTIAYDTNGRFIESMKNEAGHVEERSYDGRFGLIKSSSSNILSANDKLTTTWDYDSFGRDEKVTHADNTSTTTTHTLCSGGVNGCDVNNVGGSEAKYTIKVTQQGAPYIETVYDKLGRELATETVDVLGEKVYQDFYYDNLSRIKGESTSYKLDQNKSWSTYQYDQLSRVIQKTAFNTAVTKYSYYGYTTKTEFAYTGDGKTRNSSRSVNSQGQVVHTTNSSLVGMIFEYDAFGNLVKSEGSGNVVTQMNYDKRGNKITMSDPDQGILNYEYDVLGQLRYQRDAKFQATTFIYDVLGRMTNRTEPDMITNWVYDFCEVTLNTDGKCEGQLVEENADNGYKLTYFYDSLGRPTYERDNIDREYYVAKSYDAYGRVASLTYPTLSLVNDVTFITENTYSDSGLLKKASIKLKEVSPEHTSNGTPEMAWEVIDTDQAGRISQFKYGNGVVTDITYDQKTGNILEYKALKGTTKITNEIYDYDRLGNLKSRTNTVTDVFDSYLYDALNRVIQEWTQNSASTQTVNVTYDSRGNIKTKSDVGTYIYDTALPHTTRRRAHVLSKIKGVDGYHTSYNYDANSNLKSTFSINNDWSRPDLPSFGGALKLQVNSWDMPNVIQGTGKYTPTTTASTYQIAYNSSHERVKEELADGTLVYNISPRIDTGIHVEKLTHPDNDNVRINYYMYAGNMPFGVFSLIGRPYLRADQYNADNISDPHGIDYQIAFFHKDRLGSIVAMTDPSGNASVLDRRSYDVWGKRRNNDGTPLARAFMESDQNGPWGATDNLSQEISHSYTGHQDLAELGLIHMNGRIYNPEIGRFMSADPHVQFPEYNQSYNRYAYLNNNPMSGTDPSGYEVIPLDLNPVPVIDTYTDPYTAVNNLGSVPGGGYFTPSSLGIDLGSHLGEIYAAQLLSGADLSMSIEQLRLIAHDISQPMKYEAAIGVVGVTSGGKAVGKKGFDYLKNIFKNRKAESVESKVIEGVLDKGDRIKMIVDKIGKIKAKNADDALKQVNQIVDRVEDAHSGVKKVANPGKSYDGRMYGPRSDSVTRNPDGSITAKINKGTLRISADGEVTLLR